MAQDGHQGATGGNGHGATPPETVVTTPASPCENTNQGTWTAVPAVAADVGNGMDVVVPSVVDGEERGSATGDSRKRMKKMYDELRTILPNVNSKTSKKIILTKTIGFMRHLEDTVQKLEKQKQEIALARQATTADLESGPSSAAPPEAAQVTTLSPVLLQGWGWLPKKKHDQPAAVVAASPRIGFQTWSKKNVVLNVCGDHAYITVCGPRHPGVLTMVLSVMEKHQIDVLSVQIAGNEARTMFNILTLVNVEEIKKLDAEAPKSKDIYQLAVSEIVVWFSSA